MSAMGIDSTHFSLFSFHSILDVSPNLFLPLHSGITSTIPYVSFLYHNTHGFLLCPGFESQPPESCHGPFTFISKDRVFKKKWGWVKCCLHIFPSGLRTGVHCHQNIFFVFKLAALCQTPFPMSAWVTSKATSTFLAPKKLHQL